MTTAVQTRRLLTLDGGGVRGLFSLHLLLHLNRVRAISTTFDLIVGVSVGAMIGAMVAFGMVDNDTDTLSLVMPNFADMFRTRTRLGPMLAPAYDGRGKREVLTRVFGDRMLGDARIPLAIVVCTVDGRVLVFDSKNDGHKHLFIRDLVDASSAAPGFFPPVRLDGYGFVFDGGVIDNSPIIHTYELAKKHFNLNNNKLVLLVIGTTGIKKTTVHDNNIDSLGLLAWLGNGLVDIMMRVNDTTLLDHVKGLLGDANVMRITNTSHFPMDDFSTETLNALKTEAGAAWSREGGHMLSFLNIK